jgi:ribosomal protein S18 acetylase RimI-like enzyme
MKNFVISEGTNEEENLVKNGLFEYNFNEVPFTQESPFASINRVMKNSNGDILGGIISKMYCWNCLYITVLWVSENFRKEGCGTTLLKEVENIAKEKGCRLVHLDTFDFQAKDFYIKHGYEVFGILEDCPVGHVRYFMKKNL